MNGKRLFVRLTTPAILAATLLLPGGAFADHRHGGHHGHGDHRVHPGRHKHRHGHRRIVRHEHHYYPAYPWPGSDYRDGRHHRRDAGGGNRITITWSGRWD